MKSVSREPQLPHRHRIRISGTLPPAGSDQRSQASQRERAVRFPTRTGWRTRGRSSAKHSRTERSRTETNR